MCATKSSLTEPAQDLKRLIKGSAKARRSAARLVAVQSVYEIRQTDADWEDVVDAYIHHRLGLPEDGDVFVAADVSLMRKIVVGVTQNNAQLLDMLNGWMAPERQIGEMDQISSAILLCGAFELWQHTEIDAPIIVSSYVEVTKAFYDDAMPKLMNALLDKGAKAVRG